MKRTLLARARARKHWTLEQAAEYLQVDINTVFRWENGKATPHPYNVERLCEVYGATAADLGLEDELTGAAETAPAEKPRTQHEQAHSRDIVTRVRSQDLTLRLLKILLTWPHRNTRYDELQWLIVRETEDYDAMNATPDNPMSRRDALRRLALLPIEICGLAAVGKILKSPIEDILTHCAAGLVACQHLSRGQHDDMTLADSAVSDYLPTLQNIVKESSSYRQQAAGLTAQAYLLKAVLSVHAQGPRYAIYYAEQAAIYSKESGNLSLQLAILKRSSWIYYCDKQRAATLDKTLQARSLLKQLSGPVAPLAQSAAYSGLAKYQALGGQYDDALEALRHAHESFAASSDKDEIPAYTDYDHAHFILDGGLTYYFMGQHERAFDSFAQAIDPKTLAAKVPIFSERTRVEIINHLALASLKSPKQERDLSIHLWQAGLQGAKALKSEQRFAESYTAFEMMESRWPGEPRIHDLRDQMEHW